jgi:hypothetical protein
MKKPKFKKKPFVMNITRSESKLIDNIDKVVFNISFKKTGRKIGMSSSTVFDAWKRLRSQHKVELILVIDGYEFARKHFSDRSR